MIMEQKLVRVPFDIEMAKRIQNGEIEGRIVTRDGRSARVICWDLKAINKSYSILSLIDNGSEEVTWTYSNNGRSNTELECKHDLMLEIPEYLTFKDGDIIAYDSCCTISLIRGDFYKNDNGDTCSTAYATLIDCITIHPIVMDGARLATEPEKQKLIDALKASEDPKAKEYLKRFFGIEEKPKCEFKPFDKVLCREQKGGVWYADIFSHIRDDGKFVCIGCSWSYCIPYNEQTAHLLGTTDNWEG